jgi:hypothetical protein
MSPTSTGNLPAGYTIEDQDDYVDFSDPKAKQSAASNLPPGYTLENPDDDVIDFSAPSKQPAQAAPILGQKTNDNWQAAMDSGKRTAAAYVPALQLAAGGEGLKALPGATEAVLATLEKQAGKYAADYPHLLSLAKSLGVPSTVASVLLYLHHSARK